MRLEQPQRRLREHAQCKIDKDGAGSSCYWSAADRGQPRANNVAANSC